MSNPETAQAHDSSSTSDPAAAMVLTAEPSTVPDTAEQAHGTSGKAENGNGKVESEVVPAVAAAVTSEKLAPPLAAATTALSDPAATDVTNDNNDRKDGNVENGNNKVLAPEKVPAVATAAAVPSEKLAPPVEAATTMDVSATCLTDENNDDTNDMKDVDVDDNDDIDEVDEEEERLFQNLEHEQEEEEAKAALTGQPKDLAAAPKLLQAALQEGGVPPLSDSEQESDKEHGAAGIATKKVAEPKVEEKKEPEGEAAASASEPHYHQRVRIVSRCTTMKETTTWIICLTVQHRFVLTLCFTFTSLSITG
jgi:hypothetical protein